MSQRSIEEVFRNLAPRRRGIPAAPGITTGVTGNNGDLSTSLSQAGQEIARLRASYQQQADLIASNTQAIQSNTSVHGSQSGSSTAGKIASSLFGGALGFLSPVISGLTSLFSGSSQTPSPLPVYVPPPPVSIGGILHGNSVAPATAPGFAPSGGPQNVAAGITVNINAMDSQSFMDRSSDIANAVREAMLNNHPINGVVADL